MPFSPLPSNIDLFLDACSLSSDKKTFLRFSFISYVVNIARPKEISASTLTEVLPAIPEQAIRALFHKVLLNSGSKLGVLDDFIEHCNEFITPCMLREVINIIIKEPKSIPPHIAIHFFSNHQRLLVKAGLDSFREVDFFKQIFIHDETQLIEVFVNLINPERDVLTALIREISLSNQATAAKLYSIASLISRCDSGLLYCPEILASIVEQANIGKSDESASAGNARKFLHFYLMNFPEEHNLNEYFEEIFRKRELGLANHILFDYSNVIKNLDNTRFLWAFDLVSECYSNMLSAPRDAHILPLRTIKSFVHNSAEQICANWAHCQSLILTQANEGVTRNNSFIDEVLTSPLYLTKVFENSLSLNNFIHTISNPITLENIPKSIFEAKFERSKTIAMLNSFLTYRKQDIDQIISLLEIHKFGETDIQPFIELKATYTKPIAKSSSERVQSSEGLVGKMRGAIPAALAAGVMAAATGGAGTAVSAAAFSMAQSGTRMALGDPVDTVRSIASSLLSGAKGFYSMLSGVVTEPGSPKLVDVKQGPSAMLLGGVTKPISPKVVDVKQCLSADLYEGNPFGRPEEQKELPCNNDRHEVAFGASGLDRTKGKKFVKITHHDIDDEYHQVSSVDLPPKPPTREKFLIVKRAEDDLPVIEATTPKGRGSFVEALIEERGVSFIDVAVDDVELPAAVAARAISPERGGFFVESIAEERAASVEAMVDDVEVPAAIDGVADVSEMDRAEPVAVDNGGAVDAKSAAGSHSKKVKKNKNHRNR